MTPSKEAQSTFRQRVTSETEATGHSLGGEFLLASRGAVKEAWADGMAAAANFKG